MKQVNGNDLYNGWLKYHNTTVEEVLNKHPKEVLESSNWFNLYRVTQEQHDEWEAWAKAHIKKVTRCSKKLLERGWGLVYLNYSPAVIED